MNEITNLISIRNYLKSVLDDPIFDLPTGKSNQINKKIKDIDTKICELSLSLDLNSDPLFHSTASYSRNVQATKEVDTVEELDLINNIKSEEIKSDK